MTPTFTGYQAGLQDRAYAEAAGGDRRPGVLGAQYAKLIEQIMGSLRGKQAGLKLPKIKAMTAKEERALRERAYGGVKQEAHESQRNAIRSALRDYRMRGLGYMAPRARAEIGQRTASTLGRGWREATMGAASQRLASREQANRMRMMAAEMRANQQRYQQQLAAQMMAMLPQLMANVGVS